MEQLATGAVKEQAIETKLAGISAEWAVASMTFADYKTRGPVILKATLAPTMRVLHQLSSITTTCHRVLHAGGLISTAIVGWPTHLLGNGRSRSTEVHPCINHVVPALAAGRDGRDDGAAGGLSDDAGTHGD